MKFYALIKPHLTPLNIFNGIIMSIVVVSGAILFMVMVGMISFPRQETKQEWFEINAQILNACFTLTALMVQPQRFLLFLWTVKWVYSNGVKKREYARMIEETIPAVKLYQSSNSETTLPSPVELDPELPLPSDDHTPVWKWYTILALLNGQCIFQYPITYVQWAWIGKALERPAWVIAVFLPLSFLSGAISGIWPMLIERNRKKKLKLIN
jgi:hypothetical protein